MKILEKIKRKLKNIFIDYIMIDKICEKNVKRICEESKSIISNEILKAKDSMMRIEQDNQDYLIYKIEELKKQIEIMNNQFLYSNIELLNGERQSASQNILLVGFYGAPNLGDELMLETLLEYMKSIQNKSITIMLADNPEYNIDKYKDVKFIHYPKTLYDFNIIAQQFDYIIFGGGAIIDDKQYNNENSYKYDLGTILVKLAIRGIAFNKKVICLALSASTNLTNEDYLRKLEYIINNSYYFSVRDSFTKNALSEKFKHLDNKIIQIQDIVLANKTIYKKLSKENKPISKESIDIGIVWIANDDNLDKINKLLQDIEQFRIAQKIKKCNINFIPFYEYKNIDTKFYERVINSNSNGKMDFKIEKIANNIDEIIDIFTKNDIIIGMRYHAILIACGLNIPCVSICYDIHAHYLNKINYLNNVFENSTILSYTNFSDEDVIKNIQISLSKDKYKIAKEIEILAQNQMIKALNNIFDCKNGRK